MAEQLSNDFTEYKLSEEESLLAFNYSDLQVMGLRTELARQATFKLNLIPDATDPGNFVLEHRYIQGKIDILRELLTMVEIIRQRQEDQVRQQLAEQQQFKRG